MYLVTIFCGFCVFQAAFAQVSYVSNSVGTGVGAGFAPGFVQPFPNMIPPIMIPQVPIPYIPVPNVVGGTGGTVVSRFGPDGETTTYVSGNPYGGYKYTSTTTNLHPQQGQTVLNSRFNDDVSGGAHQTSTYVGGGGYGSGTVGTSSFVSSSNVHPQQGQTVFSSRFNDDDGGAGHQSNSFVGGGGSGTVGTSSYVSSSNAGPGYQETVSTVNNNGRVTTYRQSSGK